MASFAEIARLLGEWDASATLAINSFACPLSDAVWRFFSLVWVWAPLYLAVIFFLFKNLGWKKGLVSLLVLVLTVLSCDQIANLVKDSVARLRPCHNDYMVSNGLRILERKGGLYGFFSAHAANAMGFAVASSRLFKMDKDRTYNTYGFGIFCWAILLGASRVFVGKHYLGDVITGFVTGLVFATLISYFAEKICERFIHR